MSQSMPARVATAAAALLACTVAATPAAAAESPFSALFVIGDSLSDNGNLFRATGQPGWPYYQGRFSDGLVGADVLAAGLGLADTPAYVNLAIAGARTGMDGTIATNTGMLYQTQALLSQMPALPSTALYMVWGGGNDLRVGDNPGDSLTNLANILTRLHEAGARSFLLPNLPDLGLTPEARARGSAFASFATQASEGFNSALAVTYGALAAQWNDETFHYFDAMGAQRALTLGAPGNGLTNVTDRCLDDRGAAPTLCATPATYMYWDFIHPTATVHQSLGSQMLATVTAVPEPQSMLMLASGVVALLGLARRRQRATV